MKIKNWSKFQHFKDRRPPWIKLYRDILDDIEWHELDARASKVLVMCWLIASEYDGNLPDTKTLAFRLRMSEKDTKDCVSKLSHWLDQDDIAVISDVYQDDLLETERETEKEERQNTRRGSRLDPNFLLPEEWCSFCIKTRPELSAFDVWEQFRDYWIAQPGQKGVKTDWEATWRNWVRRQNAPKVAPADIARTTVPGTKERDPALVKLDEDRKRAAPPSLEVLAKMAALRGAK
jgi:hypothetical protein